MVSSNRDSSRPSCWSGSMGCNTCFQWNSSNLLCRHDGRGSHRFDVCHLLLRICLTKNARLGQTHFGNIGRNSDRRLWIFRSPHVGSSCKRRRYCNRTRCRSTKCPCCWLSDGGHDHPLHLLTFR